MNVLVNDRLWIENAACRSPWVDPEVFFPSERGFDVEEAALEICRGCPVVEQCRKYTIESDRQLASVYHVHGICGGLTQAQRRAIKVGHRGLTALGLGVCRECERPFRPKGTKATEFPGTVIERCKKLCTRCVTKRRVGDHVGKR